MIVAFSMSLLTGLLVLAYIDVKTFRLPDVLTFPLLGIGLFYGYISGQFRDALLGAVIGYAALVAIEIIYRRLRGRDGIGRGDAKLLAVGGAWCGWMGLPFIVLIASGSGLIAALFPRIRNYAQHGPLPFGPFLAFAIAIVWFSIQLALT